MVQLARSGPNLRPDEQTSTICGKLPAKLKIEDSLEEEHGRLSKRSRSSTPFIELSNVNNEFPVPPSEYNPLDEPSPLGLRLRKSPSLLDLIQMRLSQSNASSVPSAPSGNLNSTDKKDVNGTPASAATEKLKASNFPALLLRIGRWEYVSRYESDLVAKCYFAKHKLVWEILEDGLKSKIEIQWSDIVALKANCPDNEPGTLTVTLARPPLFYRETNPQPRKHTLWQATADFTDGQASTYRHHFLQCTQGVLNKHYEKLIQCDTRLSLLSQQRDMVPDSPYFEARSSVFKIKNESQIQEVEESETASESCSLKIEEQNSAGMTSGYLSPEAPSPSSVMELRETEGNSSHEGDALPVQQDWEQIKVPGLRPSMSFSDLVNHIGQCISECVSSGNSPRAKKALESRDMLEDIAQMLLSDTQFTTASDEQKLMSRVNSLCCLLQDPAIAPNTQVDCANYLRGQEDRIQGSHSFESISENKAGFDLGLPGNQSKDVQGWKQAPPTMSRKDSFGDLLLNLPRIASLPKFLFDISEGDENQPR